MELSEVKGRVSNRTTTFRLFFYIALLQFLLYFIVPLVVFPSKIAIDIEVISALTLGLVVGLFFLIVNLCGLYFDKVRRRLYISMLILVGLYLLWAVVSWTYIEHMDYLLR